MLWISVFVNNQDAINTHKLWDEGDLQKISHLYGNLTFLLFAIGIISNNMHINYKKK